MERSDPGSGWAEAVGASGRFRQCLHELERRAAGDAPVLLFGEAGVGKAHLARVLARRGPRGRGPLVVVDAARLPALRLDLQLHGTCNGPIGRSAYARAAGGTLLIRSVELAPPALQVRLAADMARGEWSSPRSGASSPIDARLLFTARSVEALAPELRAFLSPATVHVPGLAYRPGDPGRLADHFLARALHGRALPPDVLRLTDRARALLDAAVWHGNVGQLLEVVEQIVARRLRAVAADQLVERQLGPAPASEADDGPQPVDLAAVRALALAG